MNDFVSSQSVVSPHLLRNLQRNPYLDDPCQFPGMSNRKRKADNDPDDGGSDRMSSSPSPMPASLPRSSPALMNRTTKRPRTNLAGRPLALPRLLETLSADQMRSVLQEICSRHPAIGTEIMITAPRPSVQSAIGVLQSYQSILNESFPYGDRPSSEYAYNRVRHSLVNLIEALRDYTPHFLPPNEQSTSISLEYLDDATAIIHQLPSWDSYLHNRHKQESYEEITKAWIHVIREGAKKGGGIQLQLGKWDQKLIKHNDISGGKLQDALNELRTNLGWIGGDGLGSAQSLTASSVRQELQSGMYGANVPVQLSW